MRRVMRNKAAQAAMFALGLVAAAVAAGRGPAGGAFAAPSAALAAPRRPMAPTPPAADVIVVDAAAAGRPFPHFWERMFGSGRARLALRTSYLRDLEAVHAALGFRYVRAHGILDDDVGVYSEDAQGRPVYNFSYVDQIYDGLLKRGVRPFVEISFMPRALAGAPTRQEFWYHPYIAPPKDWGRWSDLIEAFARHLIARYGEAEVAQWYFEVWNEPNIGFWAGEPKQATYFRLYDATARALKKVSPLVRVGGPATAQAAWVGAFLRHCAEARVPVDFVSTHVYGNDSAANVFGPAGAPAGAVVSRKTMVGLAAAKVHAEVAASPYPRMPIIFSEYNASYANEPAVTDSAFMGPWLAETIRACDGLTTMMSYWTFSDVFEEQGIVRTPFYGGFGLIAEDHIPKAAFNDFRLLHELGKWRLPTREAADPAAPGPALATRRADGSLAVAAWNYAPARGGGKERTITLEFENLPPRSRARIEVVDPEQGSPLPAWRAMGEPATPTREQIAALQAAGQMPVARVAALGRGAAARVTLALPPKALALVVVTR